MLMINMTIFFRCGMLRDKKGISFYFIFDSTLLNFFFEINYRFRSVCKSFYRESQGAFIVFDQTDQNSFNKVKIWVKELENHLEEKIPSKNTDFNFHFFFFNFFS